MKRIVLFLLIVVAVGGAYGIYLFNKKPADTREEKADFEISSKELMKEFTANEENATKKYVDKVVLISGKVSEIDVSSSTLILDASDPASVTCSFYADEISHLKKIKKGDHVQIKGKCTGKLMDVVFNNCSLVISK